MGIDRVYRALGGLLCDFPARPGNWDAEWLDCAVELDEERHFNRYRRLTLESELYGRLPRVSIHAYRLLCDTREKACLAAARHGGYWSSASSDKQFGCSDLQGVLGDRGSSRWKQRAFYDFLKDLAPIFLGIPVVRISIWEQVECQDGQCRLVRDVLEREMWHEWGGVRTLIESRRGLAP